MMKEMGRIIRFFLLLIVTVISLVGCGNQGPTDKVLKDELNANIKEEWLETHEIAKIKVIESITNERDYSARILSTIEGTYAVFDMYADVEFMKYDQGWKLEDCDWNWNNITMVEFFEDKFREDAKHEVESSQGTFYEMDFGEYNGDRIDITYSYGWDGQDGQKFKNVYDRSYSVLRERFMEGYLEEYGTIPSQGDDWVLGTKYKIESNGECIPIS